MRLFLAMIDVIATKLEEEMKLLETRERLRTEEALLTPHHSQQSQLTEAHALGDLGRQGNSYERRFCSTSLISLIKNAAFIFLKIRLIGTGRV